MRLLINKGLLQFYLWVTMAYFFIGFANTASKYPTRWAAAIFNNIWGLVYLITLNFILFEYVVPFLQKKRSSIFYNILLSILLLWVFMMLYSFGGFLWRGIGIALHIYTPLKDYGSLNLNLQNQMAYSMGGVFIFGITRHIYNYVKLRQATQQLRIEKQEAELNYLKSQTNPHFLFNTLNNIYALAKEKSDVAPESIMRLSKILRFMLYETSGDFISVEQEIKVMADYLELEKLRYDDSLRINFNYDIENLKQAIPPLLLIPLVENAFKHGVSETRGNPFVDIHLSIGNRQLTFVVKNSTEQGNDADQVKENIGLSNLRRQLELLYTDHVLKVEQRPHIFIATLQINLASHV